MNPLCKRGSEGRFLAGRLLTAISFYEKIAGFMPKSHV